MAVRNTAPHLIKSPIAAREWLGIVPGTLRIWRTPGKGPKYTKIGGTVFYKEADLQAYIDGHEFENTSQHDAVVA